MPQASKQGRGGCYILARRDTRSTLYGCSLARSRPNSDSTACLPATCAWLQTTHTIASQGYVIYNKRSKLKGALRRKHCALRRCTACAGRGASQAALATQASETITAVPVAGSVGLQPTTGATSLSLAPPPRLHSTHMHMHMHTYVRVILLDVLVVLGALTHPSVFLSVCLVALPACMQRSTWARARRRSKR